MDILNEKEAFCFLKSLKGFLPPTIDILFEHFNSYSVAVKADASEIEQLLSRELSTLLLNTREQKGIHYAYNDLTSKNMDVHLQADTSYPNKLRTIPDAPAAIFSLGRLPNPELPSVAIIGARNCSAYGSDIAQKYAKSLAECGIQVISGMARGIDGIAQKTALYNGGYSCGILGCGVDICYPREHKELYEDLKIHGGLVSEYYPGTMPLPQFFPARNRIISGLCDALLVIEAKAKSGTIITVNTALEQNRDIYALPGRITDELSYGCNMLIRDGAIPLLNPDDFLRTFLEAKGYTYNPANQTSKSSKTNNKTILPSMSLTAEEKAIISALDYTPKTIDEIFTAVCRISNMTLPSIMATLTGLVIKKQIGCVNGSNYYLEHM